MRKAFTALMMMLLFVPSAFGLSDNEYRSMMNASEFRVAVRKEYIKGLTSSPQKPKGNGQTALILGDTVQIYSRADKNSASETIDAPSERLTVFETKRDKNNDLGKKTKTAAL